MAVVAHLAILTRTLSDLQSGVATPHDIETLKTSISYIQELRVSESRHDGLWEDYLWETGRSREAAAFARDRVRRDIHDYL